MRLGSLAKQSRLSDVVAAILLAVCLLLAACGHVAPVPPLVAEAASQSRTAVAWQEHAYKSGGFHYVPVRTFVLGQAEDPPTTLTPAAPEQPMVTLQRHPLPREVVIHFALDSADLCGEARQALGSVLDQLKGAQGVTVVGFTCALGSQQRNDQLARARAETVAAFLKANGVPVAGVAGRGKCCFVAPNDTEDGRAQNRRVVVSCLAGD